VSSACVNVGRCQVIQAFVVALKIVVPDEGRDMRFEITGQEVILQQDAVLKCLMPPFRCPAVDTQYQ